MKSAFILLLSFFSAATMAQNHYQISGLVTDSDDKGIDLAVLSLYHLEDSSLVKTQFTDNDGSYTFRHIEAGDYFLIVKQMGFNQHETVIKLTNSIVLPAIMLMANDELLKEVTVKSQTPFVVRKIDRTVITPDALATNAGSNALEVLEQAPGVLVDQDGNIVFKGRTGVAVYINDKPSYLSGSELENYLRTLPAGSIKSIELIENPPAQIRSGRKCRYY